MLANNCLVIKWRSSVFVGKMTLWRRGRRLQLWLPGKNCCTTWCLLYLILSNGFLGELGHCRHTDRAEHVDGRILRCTACRRWCWTSTKLKRHQATWQDYWSVYFIQRVVTHSVTAEKLQYSVQRLSTLANNVTDMFTDGLATVIPRILICVTRWMYGNVGRYWAWDLRLRSWYYELSTIQFQIISLNQLCDISKFDFSELSITGRDNNVSIVGIPCAYSFLLTVDWADALMT